MERTRIASYLDYSLLRADTAEPHVRALCEHARQLRVAAVCVNSVYLRLCSELLAGSGVKTCTTIGFPLGAAVPAVKACEANYAVSHGADELDMVINIGALKSGNESAVLRDITVVREASPGKTLKVIIETAYLTENEKVTACRLAQSAGADFVKTSTGFGPRGATVDDIRLMHAAVPALKVKAAGGIKTYRDAMAMIEAGASRIGTSAAEEIIRGEAAALA